MAVQSVVRKSQSMLSASIATLHCENLDVLCRSNCGVLKLDFLDKDIGQGFHDKAICITPDVRLYKYVFLQSQD